MKLLKYIVVLFGGTAFAQQLPMYNHYFIKPIVYNPAFAGNNGDIQAALISRAQWVSFSGAPQLNMIALDGAVKDKKVGLGLVLTNDRRGISIRNSAMLSYAYRFNFNEDAYLSLGLAAGIANQSIDFNKAIAENYSDPTLLGGTQQKTMIDLNAGLLFGWKGLQLAASAPQLLENRYNYADNTGTKTYMAEVRHYVASVKYRFLLSKDKGIGLAPQFLIRSVPNTPFQFDGNLTFDWENRCWLGATYKSNYALCVNAGITIHKQLSIGYSYEIITADIGKYSGVSHELFLNFKFGGGTGSEASEAQPTPDASAQESAYKQRIDSLQQALQANSEQIAEMNRKLDQQLKAQQEAKSQMEAMEQNMRNNQSQQNNNVSQNTSQNNNYSQSESKSQNENANATQYSEANTSGGNQSADQTSTAKNKSSKEKQTTKTTTGKNTSGGGNTEPANTQSHKGNAASSGNSTSGVTPKAPAALDLLDSKVYEKNVWIASYPTGGYKDENNLNPKPGYYIIVGTFFYQDFAIAEVQRFRKRGYKECNWIYSENTKHNYIFTRRVSSREEAIRKVKEVQTAAVKDAWVLELK